MMTTHPAPNVDDRVESAADLVALLVDSAVSGGADPGETLRVGHELLDLIEALADENSSVGLIDGAALPVPNEPITDLGEEYLSGTLAAIAVAAPHDAVIAVVTRGDHRLLEVPDRRCVHYPAQDDGAWIGFHPRDDMQALALLTRSQLRGATHLVLPAPSMWWLHHYPGWRNHLEQRGTLVHASPHALVWSLAEPLEAPFDERTETTLHLQQLRELVDAVLPVGCTVLVASGDPAALALGDRRAVAFPRMVGSAESTPAADLLAAIHRARRSGAHYLLLPAEGSLSARRFDDLRASIRSTFPLVLERPPTASIHLLAHPSQGGPR